MYHVLARNDVKHLERKQLLEMMLNIWRENNTLRFCFPIITLQLYFPFWAPLSFVTRDSVELKSSRTQTARC